MPPRCAIRSVVLMLAFGLGVANMRGESAPLQASPFGRVIASPTGAPGGNEGKGNRIAMLSSGYNALLVRVHLIRHATRSVSIQTFIWTNDEVGRLFIWELLEAARRGVKVRIIADHMFSDQDPDIVAFLATAHPNFEVRHYRPAASRIKPAFWRTALASIRSFHELNQRMHSKVLIVDDAVLLTGGRNIENTYFDHATGLNFRDRDVMAVGPVVETASAEFEQFWSYEHTIPSRDLKDVGACLAKGGFRRFDRREDYDFGGYFSALDVEAGNGALIESRFTNRLKPVDRARFLYDAPGKSRRSAAQTAGITRELAALLQAAKSSVLLQTPYLVLSPAARDLFKELRRRNPAVEVRISTNSFASTDNLYAYSANYRLRNVYVESLGLRIHEFKPQPAELLEVFPTYPEMCGAAQRRARGDSPATEPFLSLHAKSLVVDDAVAFVGSFNLDPRSERLNTEVGLLVMDTDFARELRAEIERDLRPENSWTIARRRLPLRLEALNGIVESTLSLSPIDLWPIQNTTSFELLPGREPVAPEHRAFYDYYREAGLFPGAEGMLSQKEILTRLFKAVGAPLTPIL